MALDALRLLADLNLESFHTSLGEHKKSPIDAIIIYVDLFDFAGANLLLECVLYVIVNIHDKDPSFLVRNVKLLIHFVPGHRGKKHFVWICH